MSNWDQFKNRTKPEEKPQGRKVRGMYQCQLCGLFVTEATYYPVDSVLKYICSDEHTSFIEDFKLAF